VQHLAIVPRLRQHSEVHTELTFFAKKIIPSKSFSGADQKVFSQTVIFAICTLVGWKSVGITNENPHFTNPREAANDLDFLRTHSNFDMM
jgi:hypothetical protein